MPRRAEKPGKRNNRFEEDYDDTYDEPPSSKNKQPPKSRVEVHQPTTEVWDYENHWQKDLCADCCDDCSMCAFAFFCTPCFIGKLFTRTNECCCNFMLPGALMSLRTKLRTGFRIKGSVFKDCLASSCCTICTAIQMAQELDKQEL